MNSLKVIMRLNALSCFSFGLLFIFASHVVADFLGQVPSSIVIALGIGLLGNGGHLIIASRRTNIRQNEVIWFSLGDFSWWLVTLALIVSDTWITSYLGIGAALAVATVVAGLGVAQLWNLGLQLHGHTNRQHLNAFIKSWLALPLWVKIWLLCLNGVFLFAIVLLPDRTAEVTLIAYFATAPLLAGQAGFDGGLRRILGVAHLIPWIPLLAWLLLVPTTTLYSTLLSFTVGVCLAFGANDLWLFIKGDRKIVGETS